MKLNPALLLTVLLPGAGVLAAIVLVARHPFYAETVSAEPLSARAMAAAAVVQIDPATLAKRAPGVAPAAAVRLESVPVKMVAAPPAKSASESIAPAPRETIAIPPPPEPPLTLEEHDFLEKAAAISMAEMELAKLARERAATEEVKVLARELLIYQSRTVAALRELAKWKKAKVKIALNPAQLELLAAFRDKEGEEFDIALREHIAADGWMALQVYWNGASVARNFDVKAFAERTLGELKGERPVAARAMRELQIANAPGIEAAENAIASAKLASRRDAVRAFHPAGMKPTERDRSAQGMVGIVAPKAKVVRLASRKQTDAPIAFTTAEQIMQDVKKSSAGATASRSSRLPGSMVEEDANPLEIRNGPVPRRIPILVGGERPKMRSSAEETRIAYGVPVLLAKP